MDECASETPSHESALTTKVLEKKTNIIICRKTHTHKLMYITSHESFSLHAVPLFLSHHFVTSIERAYHTFKGLRS